MCFLSKTWCIKTRQNRRPLRVTDLDDWPASDRGICYIRNSQVATERMTGQSCMHCMRRGLVMIKLSVRLSNRDLWQNEKRCARILIPHGGAFTLVLWQEEWLVGGQLQLKFWVKPTQLQRKRRFSIDSRS